MAIGGATSSSFTLMPERHTEGRSTLLAWNGIDRNGHFGILALPTFTSHFCPASAGLFLGVTRWGLEP
jgi:hypothetical protein